MSEEIPISTIVSWIGVDFYKWHHLAGSIFVHNRYGRMTLIKVEIGDLLVMEWGDRQSLFEIKTLAGFFSCVFPCKAHHDDIFVYHKKLGLKKEEAPQQEKMKIAEGFNIRAFCIKHKFDEDEVLRLANTDTQRANAFIERIVRNETISKPEIEWAVNTGAQNLVKNYLKDILFKNIDGKNFEGPENIGVNYSIWWGVAAIHDYKPKRGDPNPSQETSRILEFKDGEAKAIRYYTQRLNEIIGQGVVVCAAPSSSVNTWGRGLSQAVQLLGKYENRLACDRLLRRNANTKKRSHGGDRSIELNLATIEVTNISSLRDRPVVVIDDVTTSGNTLKACSKLIWEAGCNCVGAIALGRTR